MSKKQPIPFGKYLLLDRVNIGGMAEVWKAKTFGAEGFEKLVAIKRILPNIAEDEEFITMFIDEAKISVQLTHANIAQVFDLGKIGESYYIAMEYVSGKDLRAIFDKARKRGEPAPIPLTCYCLAKAAEGLDYAHRKRDAQGQELNIVHRDVSPQNILCSFDGETKVIDFGIAKAANKATKTQAGILKGKFGYMSPEQVRGLPLDRRSDVFALGVVLYEMLTGERLFVGESDFSVLEKVRAVDILPPTNYNRRIPPALEKIVLKALAKDVEDRFSYASELGDELQRFLITSDTIFSRKDLQQFMKSTFAEDVEREKIKLAEYSEIKLPPGMAALAGIAVPQAAPPPSAPSPAAEMLVSSQSTSDATMMVADKPPAAPAGRPPQMSNPGLRQVSKPGIPGPPPSAVRTSMPPGMRPGVPGPPVVGRPGGPVPVGARPTGVQPALRVAPTVSRQNVPVVAPPAPPPTFNPQPASLPDLDASAAIAEPEPERTVDAASSVLASRSRPPPMVIEADDGVSVVTAAPKKKSKLPLIIGVAGGVAVLGGVAAGAILFMGGGGGSVLLNSTPDQNLIILVDGNAIEANSTPKLIPKLAAGEHQIQITTKGYEVLEKSVMVAKEKTTTIDVTLTPKGGAAAPAEIAQKPEAPKPDVKAPAPVPAPPTAAPARSDLPALIVLRTAGAEVSVDGKVVIGKDSKDAVFTGSLDGNVQHLVEAKLAGYKPFSQTLKPGEPVKLTSLELQKL